MRPTKDDGQEPRSGIVRILQLLHRLCVHPEGARVGEWTEQFRVSERTIFRDLIRIEAAGIPLERKGGRVRLGESESNRRLAHKLGDLRPGVVRIEVPPHRFEDLARALLPCLDLLDSIEPEGFAERVRAEALRLSRSAPGKAREAER